MSGWMEVVCVPAARLWCVDEVQAAVCGVQAHRLIAGVLLELRDQWLVHGCIHGQLCQVYARVRCMSVYACVLVDIQQGWGSLGACQAVAHTVVCIAGEWKTS